MRKIGLLLVAGVLAAWAGAAVPTCRVTVTLDQAEGDNLRLLPTATDGVWVADAPVDGDFTATVLPNIGRKFSVADSTLPAGMTFNPAMGSLVIPKAILAANKETGVALAIATTPIRYTIHYRAHGDGEPGHATESLTTPVAGERGWDQAVSTANAKVTLATRGTLNAPGWEFHGWSRTQGVTAPEFQPGETCAHLVTMDGETITLYAVWMTKPEVGKVSYPITLQNGSFETPALSNNQTYVHFAGAVIRDTTIDDSNKIGWSTTGTANLVEIGRLTSASAISQYGVNSARDGQQIAELNATGAGLLYQRIATLPNTTLHWGFSHRARSYSPTNETSETLSMWIGSADQIEQARAIYDCFAVTNVSSPNHISRDVAMERVAALAEKLKFTNIVHTAYGNANKTAWDDIKGDFVVPSGRVVTEYAFVSWVEGADGTASSYGNLIDRVYLADRLPKERFNLKITHAEGGAVWVNDAQSVFKVERETGHLSSYDKARKMSLSIGVAPGYNFTGMMKNGEYLNVMQTEAFIQKLITDGAQEDLTLDFLFVGDSMVSFRPNGGTYCDESGETIASVKLALSRPHTLGPATRTGYVFLGWRALNGALLKQGAVMACEADANTGEMYLVGYDADGTTELLRVSSAEGVTLYAQWEIDENAVAQRATYEVSLVAMNVTGDGATLKPVAGSATKWNGKGYANEDFVTTLFPAGGYRLPDTIEVRGKTRGALEGWSYNKTTGVVVIPGALMTEDVTLTVTGERIQYTIFYSTGGTGEITGAGVESVPGATGVWQQSVVAEGETITLAARGTLASDGWTFLGWARAPDATDADYQPGATVAHLTRLHLAVVKLYGIWKADDGSLASSYPVTLQNGGFEVPVNTKSYYVIYPETTEGLCWQTTASDNKIEIGSVSTNLSPSGCISSYHTAQARDGQQFAELNANYVGALYQDVATVPGVTLYYGFSHRARAAGDALALMVASTNDFDTALAIYTNCVTSKPEGWQEKVLHDIKALNLPSLRFIYHEAPYDISDLTEWTDLTGEYKVPAGQNVTKFAFLSLSKHSKESEGNLIDRVYFTTSEPLHAATLTALVTTGGAAKINDGGADYVDVTPDNPYFKVVSVDRRVVISPVAEADWSFLGCYLNGVFYARAACDELLAFDMPPANRKLTLLFAKERTITFNLEGGSLTAEFPSASQRLSTTLSEYTLKAPTRAGYTFKGWREATTGQMYEIGTVVRYEVEAQYDENVRSYLVCGSGKSELRVESENGLVLNAVWEISSALVDRKVVTFVDYDYSKPDPKPYLRLDYAYLALGASRSPFKVTATSNILVNATANRPAGYEPAGWTYEPDGGGASIAFDYVWSVAHKADAEDSYFLVTAVTNGVADNFRFDGISSMRFVARWDRFYDVTRLEDDGVTTNRTVWVPKSWLDAKGDTAITEDSYATDLVAPAANGVPLWQNYIFGLDPNRTDLPVFNRLAHRASAGGNVRFALDGISVVKYLNDIYQYKSGNTVYTPFAAHDYRTYKVAFVLCGTNDDRTAGPWTALGDAQPTPVFEVDPEALVYRFYRIEARITAP